jgi:hypothetical protein
MAWLEDSGAIAGRVSQGSDVTPPIGDFEQIGVPNPDWLLRNHPAAEMLVEEMLVEAARRISAKTQITNCAKPSRRSISARRCIKSFPAFSFSRGQEVDCINFGVEALERLPQSPVSDKSAQLLTILST